MLPVFTGKLMAQNDTPCECSQRWTEGAAWNMNGTVNENPPPMSQPKGIVKCSGTEEVQANISTQFGCTYNPTEFPITVMSCTDPITGLPMPTPLEPAVGTPIIFLNFDVRPNVGTFQVQINENSGMDNIGWALYYTANPTTGTGAAPQYQSGDCNNLISYLCGEASANTWMTFVTPNFTQATNFYLAIWDQDDDGDLELADFKTRFGCGNGDLYCTLETGAEATTCNPNGTYTVNIPIVGQNGNYVGTDPNAVNSPSAAVCLTNVGDGGPTSGIISLTYPYGTPYDIDIAIETAGACPDPIFPTACSETISGPAPDCCTTPPNCSITGPASVCPNETGIIFTGPAGMDSYQWTITGNGVIVGSSTGQTVEVTSTASCGGSFTLTLDVELFTCVNQCMVDVQVNDVVGPTVSCPTAVNLAACPTQASLASTFSSWLSSFTAMDNCGPPTLTGISGAVPPSVCGGTTTINFTATDDCNNSAACSSTFTVAPADNVVLTCPTNVVEMACQSQPAITNMYNDWLSDATISGGCNAVLTNNSTGPPSACGGTATVTFTVTSACQPTMTCTRTFTVNAAPVVSLNCPTNITLAACQTQAQIDSEYATWLASATATGGCNAVFTNNSTGAPSACGGTSTVTFTVTSDCQAPVTCTRTFTVTAAPVVNLVCPANVTEAACQTQAQIDAKYAAWLATATASGGCNAVFTNNSPGAPLATGGSATVTFTVISDCEPTMTCTRTFTVEAPLVVSLTCPANVTEAACQTQAEINTKYNAWIASVTFTGGCNAVLTNNSPGAPSACGGSRTVTFTVTSSNQAPVTCTRTFTVTMAPLVSLTCPSTTTEAACQTQAEINAKFSAWLALASVSGGCNPVLTNNNVGAPSACGGTTTVTFTVNSSCQAPVTCTRIFTVSAAPAVNFNCPVNVTEAACQTQGEIDSKYAAWLATATVSGGCNAVLTNNSTGAPSACGGTASVTFTVTSDCQPPITCTRTFTVNANSVVLTCPSNVTEAACQTQAEIDTKYAAWLATASSTGGCNAVLTNNSTGAPAACGGTSTVTFTVTSDCQPPVTCTRTFTVTAAPVVNLNCPTNTIEAPCQTQAEINAKYNTWLATATASGGCNAVFTNNSAGAPPACGGSTSVTFTVTSDCQAPVTCTRTFTVTTAPTVNLNCPVNVTETFCQTQAEINAKYAAWLATATVTGGCNAVLTNNSTGAPLATGGSVTVTFTLTSDCQSVVTCTRTFTVETAPLVSLTCPTDRIETACQTQAEITAKYNAWIAMATFTGGCNAVLTNNSTAPPSACGGTATVTFTVTSSNQPPVTCTRTFTVNAAPAVSFTCPVNVTEAACQSQADIDSKYTAWLATASVSGGCNAVLTNNSTGAPSACGGTATITFTVMSDCGMVETCTRTFTVNAAPVVNLTCPANMTEAACQTQAEIDSKYAAWLASATVSGGCNTVLTNNSTGAPLACGGTSTVTFTVMSDCQAPVTCTRTFTVNVSSVVLICPSNMTEAACQTQAEIDMKYAAWLASATASGGCGTTLTNNSSGAPLACGGSTTVTFTVTSNCQVPVTCTRTFTVTAAPAVNLNCPINTVEAFCQTQAEVDAKYADWLATAVVTGGCNAVLTNNSTGAPAACGGTSTVTFTVTSDCQAPVTCTRTFTVSAAPAVNLNCPADATEAACQTQAQIDTKFNAWLASATVSGGCNVVFTNNNAGAPPACGGTTTVTFTATSSCQGAVTCTRSFTVSSAAPVSITCPPDVTEAACQTQAQINAKYNAWLTSAMLSGGCNAVLTNNSTGAPAACGGTATVTFTASSTCQAPVTCTRTFTVSASPVVNFVCPANVTEAACQSQADINANYAAWLASATVSGGCNAVLTNNSAGAPSACGGTATVTFNVMSDCGMVETCTRTYTVNAAPVVNLTCPDNVTELACQTQTEIDSKYNTWLNSVTMSGGCNAVLTNNNPGPPSACGGTSTVTFTVTSNCQPPVTCTRTFTVAVDPIVLTCPTDVTETACQTQAEIDAAYAVWLASASASGGCGVVLTNNSTGAPSACGGSVSVTFTATGNCPVPVTCTRTFTVVAAPTLNLNCPTNVTELACQTQVQIDSKFSAWLATATASGGCNAVLTNNNTGAPSACGGSVSVTFTATNGCGLSVDCTRTFTVNAPATPVLTCPAPLTMPMLSTQAEIDAAFATWLASASASGGCSGVLTNDNIGSPSVCGGSTTVTFTYTTTCSPALTCSETFTVPFDQPGIRVAKYFAGIDYSSSSTPGNFDVITEIIIENVGSPNLGSLGIIDNLSSPSNLGTAFVGVTQAPQIVAVGALGATTTASINPTPNASYNGTGNLLNSNGLLMPGERVVVQFRFEVNPDAAGAPSVLKNQVTALGTVNNCSVPIVVSDLSDAGPNPLTSNANWLGDSGGSDDPTLLTNCWALLDNGIACNDLLQVSLNQFCEIWLTPNMVLEGEYAICSNNSAWPLGTYYEVFMVTDAQGNPVPDLNPSTANIHEISGSYIGQSLMVKIKDKVYSNSCWGTIYVEDKMAPAFTCPSTPVQVTCTANLAFVQPPVVVDNCDPNPVVTLVSQQTIDNNICDGVYIVRRTYKATDNQGNMSANCVQNIHIVRPPVDFPDDITWTCNQYDTHPTIVNPTKLNASITDTNPAEPGIDVSPTLSASILAATGSGVVNVSVSSICAYNVFHSDDVTTLCGDGFKILRTWTVIDWCNGSIITTGVGGEDNVQVIKVADNIAPIITRAPFTLSANVPAVHPNPCRSTGLLLPPTFSDNCNAVTIQINTPVGPAIMNGMNGGTIPAPGLGLGTHLITYIATDACGNSTSINVPVTIVDNISPAMVCVGVLEVDLPSSPNATATVLANLFDNGTTDNCCLHHFEVRRMTEPCDDGHNDTVFGPSVVFCCEDIASSPVMVVLRAYDCHGNFNDCMVEVEVNDKQAPLLVTCPPTERITCDVYADDYQAQLAALGNNQIAKSQFLDADFGQPVFVDNCSSITVSRTFDSNLSQCLEGIITRTWMATDAEGQTSATCTQAIFVDHVSDFGVSFPADITVTCGQSLPSFGEPTVFNESCEMIAITFDDSPFEVVPDACYKIIRTWQVVNWCVQGAVLDQEVVEVPESALGLPFPQCDLDGDGDCDSRTFRDSWTATQRPTAVNATVHLGPDTDPDSDPWDGVIVYQQVVKVIDTTAPVFTSCTLPDVCIVDSNSCAVTFSLQMPVVTDCSPQVTVTANTPGLGAGFGPFTAGPGTYTTTFTANDGCNNSTNCTTTFTVMDCKKPSPQCLTGLVVPIMNTLPPEVTVSASALNGGATDNCPGALIVSFSQNTNETTRTFTCDDEGDNMVEIWFTDAASNQDFCITTITIEDNTNSCMDDTLVVNLGGQILNEDDAPVSGVSVSLSGQSNGTLVTTSNGTFTFNNLPAGQDLTVIPSKDSNPLAGVTTYDLVLISKHILNIQLLDSPYKLIAADINNSKTITTFDMVELRKLILQIDSDFANNTSWRFVDKGYVFPVPTNPWAETFPEVISINDIPAEVLDADFVAVKIGDVNNSSAFTGDNNEDRSSGSLIFEAKNEYLTAGKTYACEFNAKDFEASGYQFTLDFDADLLEFVEVGEGTASASSFGLAKLVENALTSSWNQHGEQAIEEANFTLFFKAKKNGRLGDALWLSDRFTRTEAYSQDGQMLGIQLQFVENEAVAEFELFQNKPNPFSKETVIGFRLPKVGPAQLTITDASGRVLKSLKGNYQQGYNEVRLSRNELGLAAGILYYRLATDSDTDTKMMLLTE